MLKTETQALHLLNDLAGVPCDEAAAMELDAAGRLLCPLWKTLLATSVIAVADISRLPVHRDTPFMRSALHHSCAPVADNHRHQICTRVPHHYAAPAAQSSSHSSYHICTTFWLPLACRHAQATTVVSNMHSVPVLFRGSLPVAKRIEVGVLWLRANGCGIKQKLQGSSDLGQQGSLAGFMVGSELRIITQQRQTSAPCSAMALAPSGNHWSQHTSTPIVAYFVLVGLKPACRDLNRLPE